jgi:very-short-patch-repair endonuclease
MWNDAANIINLAERRHGIVTIEDLASIGITRRTASRLAREGVLRCLYRGSIFAIGEARLDMEAEVLAASLALPHGWVSGTTAATYWGLRRIPRDRIQMTVQGTTLPRVANMRIRRTRFDAPDVVETLSGGRVSSPVQTLFEIAGELDDRILRSVLEDALNRNLVTADQLNRFGSAITQMGRDGSTRFRRIVMDRVASLPPAMSHDEIVLMDALELTGLEWTSQYPLRLARGNVIHLDAALPELRMGLELDGELHDTPVAIHRDKHRDLLAAAEGWMVLRPTTDDVRNDLRATVATIMAAVEHRVRGFHQAA